MPESPVPDRSGHLRVSGREIKVNTHPILSYRHSQPKVCAGRMADFTQNSFANAPQFDVLIFPGSFSTRELSEATTSFVAAQCSSPDLHAVFSVSSGILHLTQTGLLWKRRASAPRSLIPALQQRYPDTLWQTKAWNRHENIWTSSTALSALDMIAAWMREFFWDRHEAVECALLAAGIGSLDDFDY